MFEVFHNNILISRHRKKWIANENAFQGWINYGGEWIVKENIK